MAVQQQDSTVTRRYFYSIKDISIGGRCECNGHADKCVPQYPGSTKLVCQCKHNTCGDSCDMCCPGFEQKKWLAAVPRNPHRCEACNCHGHSDQCVYDPVVDERQLSIDVDGEFSGGGVCQNCRHNTAGINCELCTEGFYRPDGVDATDPQGCVACQCESDYTIGSCEPKTGKCYCKPEYDGEKCDRCAPGYFDYPECKKCDCFYNGTSAGDCFPTAIGNQDILEIDDFKMAGGNDFDSDFSSVIENGFSGGKDKSAPEFNNNEFKNKDVQFKSCNCKENFSGPLCNQCADGFFNFPNCESCQCQGDGIEDTNTCDIVTGSCACRQGYVGEKCDSCDVGYFNYPLCQPCACSNVGTTGDVCDVKTGECYCDSTYDGDRCDRCQPGFWGFPSCTQCECNGHGAIDDICDAQTGQCNCHEGYRVILLKCHFVGKK